MLELQGSVDFGPEQNRSITFRTRGRTTPQFKRQFYPATGPIQIPADQFMWRNRIRDEIVLIFREGKFVPARRRYAGSPPRPGCWIVVLESPHRDEYSATFSPLGPLQNRESRKRFYRYIRSLCREIGGLTNGVEIVLCNPVPYQTSLARLMEDDAGIQSAVRNAVWRELFRQGFTHEFESRLQAYQPSVVINACTYDLRNEVGTALKQYLRQATRKFCIFTCNRHPCIWIQRPVLKMG